MPESASAPKVSIIIPVYNGAESLEATLKGVFALRATNFAVEVIVVDNNSTDGSAHIAALFPTRVVHAERRNRAHARNTGALAASGDYLCFLDCDCVPKEDWLEELIPCLSRREVGAVQGAIVPKGSTAVSYTEFAHAHMGIPFIDTKGCILTRVAWNNVGSFDESLTRCEDIDLGWRLITHGYEILFVNNTSVECGVPKGLFHTLNRAWDSARGLRQVHKKWGKQLNLTLAKISLGFLSVARRNSTRRAGKSGLPLFTRTLYILDDLLTGLFYFIRIGLGG